MSIPSIYLNKPPNQPIKRYLPFIIQSKSNDPELSLRFTVRDRSISPNRPMFHRAINTVKECTSFLPPMRIKQLSLKNAGSLMVSKTKCERESVNAKQLNLTNAIPLLIAKTKREVEDFKEVFTCQKRAREVSRLNALNTCRPVDDALQPWDCLLYTSRSPRDS